MDCIEDITKIGYLKGLQICTNFCTFINFGENYKI
jgi:hypothetical protein